MRNITFLRSNHTGLAEKGCSAMNLESPALLLSAFNAAPTPLWLIEPDGSVALINEAAGSVLGYANTRRLIGRSSHETLHPRLADGSPYPAHTCPIVSAAGSVSRSRAEEFIDTRGRHLPVRWRLRELEDSHFKLLSFTPRPSRARAASQRSQEGTATFDEIKTYIEAHCEDPRLTPKNLAAHSGLSLRKLQALFAIEDTSPAVEIRKARLIRGHRLLTEGKNVEESAFSCGFNDVSTFSRAYRRTFHRSPSRVKDTAQQPPSA